MTRYFKFWPFLAGAAIGFIWMQHNAALRNEGALHEQLRALETRNAQLEDQDGRIDTVYRTDTITLRKVRYATDTLLQRDTVIHTDTVRQLIQQERNKCDAVVLTCESQKANLRAQIANLDSTITVLNKQHPGWFRRTTGKIAWLGAGVAAGVLIK